MARLDREFYLGDTVQIARNLLGKYLVRMLHGEALVCRITETEAYIGRCDKACHAYNYRRTPRTEVLFGESGHAYVYLIYGMHHCLNLVTEPEGEPAAVLLRGGEAISGIETISRLRFGKSCAELTASQRKNFLNGPGKLCKGLFITSAENTMDLTGDTLFLCDCPADVGLPCPTLSPERIVAGPRVGIDYAEEARDFPWRFQLIKEENPHASF
ncbi:MAG: DNA-3-methyladenine glycosylase [Oscillibacter sp.]|jgi:DNA-3-methyladenine glycosylase|nr:DNA-3-methyladenine glycosylase [Oscillibacter sp.]